MQGSTGTTSAPSVWVRQLREDCTRQHLPQFMRLFFSMRRFQKLLKKMPFNNILPQVQSIKVDAFLCIARFPKQNTMKVMVVNGMFLISGRMKNIGHEL